MILSCSQEEMCGTVRKHSPFVGFCGEDFEDLSLTC